MPDERPGVLRQAKALFPRLRPELSAALEGYRRVLEAVHPLKPRHAQELPLDIKDLSLALTADRGPGPEPNYLAHPASLSAYLYYFLPWNLYRLSRLLSGLDWDLPEGASVLDLGAGPLTLAQALWISRPELRTRRIRFVCVDQTGNVLRLGRGLFEELAGEEGRNWTIELVQGPIHKAPGEYFSAVCALNSLNELGKGRGEEGYQALDRLAGFIAGRLAPGGRMLLVEPGTRQGGKLLAKLRDILLEDAELQTLGPCTHQESCPMLAPKWRSWCHFVFPTEDAPGWLAKLSKSAGLEKDRVSLSYLEMLAGEREFSKKDARIVSGRFMLPQGQACYACAADGLHLLTFKRFLQNIVPGAFASIDWPERGGKDPKSGAWLTPLSDREQAEAPVAVEKPVAAVRKSKHPAWAKLPSQRPRKPAVAGGNAPAGQADSGGKPRPEDQPKTAGRRAPGGKPGSRTRDTGGKPEAGRNSATGGQRSDEGSRGDEGKHGTAGERDSGGRRGPDSGRDEGRGRGGKPAADGARGERSRRDSGDDRASGGARAPDRERAPDRGRGEESGRGGGRRDGDGREREPGNRRGEGRERPAGNRRGEGRGAPSGRTGPDGRSTSGGKRDAGDTRDSGDRRGEGRGRASGGKPDTGGKRTGGGTPAPYGKQGPSGKPASSGKRRPSGKPSPAKGRGKTGRSGKPGASGKPAAGGKPSSQGRGR